MDSLHWSVELSFNNKENCIADLSEFSQVLNHMRPSALLAVRWRFNHSINCSEIVTAHIRILYVKESDPNQDLIGESKYSNSIFPNNSIEKLHFKSQYLIL